MSCHPRNPESGISLLFPMMIDAANMQRSQAANTRSTQTAKSTPIITKWCGLLSTLGATGRLHTPFMHSHLPVRTTVGFRDVNWAVEADKSQQGFERRKKAQQRRAERKHSRRIGKMTKEHLQSFLLFAVSADENAAQILSMDACNELLRQAENTEFVTFQDGETNVNKVQLLLDMFDSLKSNRVLRALILSWMDEAIRESLYSFPDGDSLTCSSISSKPSSYADSQASQIATVDIDVAKVEEFGRVIALLEVDEIEKQLKVMNIQWETMPGTWETAQVYVNEIIRKIEALELGSENLVLRTKAIASFQEETDFQTRVHFLRLALRDNTTGAVLADSIADESVPDDDSLTYSSISSKPSSDADSQASQIATVDIDVAKVKEFGRVIALLEVDEIEKQLKIMDFQWETMPGTWETAQVHINEIIRKIEALELGSENLVLRTKAIASFQEETDFQTRVHFLRLALRDNTTGAVLADSVADESGSTHASSAEQHGTHP